MDERLDRIGNEARRRIIWGDPLPDVVAWLQSQGLSKPQIEAIVGSFVRERNAAIRARGIRKSIIGGILVVISTLVFVWDWSRERPASARRRTSMAYVVGLLYVVGAWQLGTGIYYLISGSKAGGSVTDL